MMSAALTVAGAHAIQIGGHSHSLEAAYIYHMNCVMREVRQQFGASPLTACDALIPLTIAVHTAEVLRTRNDFLAR